MESNLDPNLLSLKNHRDALVAIIYSAIREYPNTPTASFLEGAMEIINPQLNPQPNQNNAN
jgi:hypothetical protein